MPKKRKKEKKDEIYETIFADRGNLASWGGLKGAAAASRSGGLYGLLLLFAALELHIIRLEAVREVGRFLIEIMPLMFIPAAVGLLESWESLQAMLIPAAVIMAVSTIIVMASAGGSVTQYVIRKGGRKKHE